MNQAHRSGLADPTYFPATASARYVFGALALWLAAPLAFLGVYVLVYHQRPIVIIEHLYLVGLLAAYCWLVKVCLHRILPWRTVADVVSTVNEVSVLLSLWAYYLLVAIGLRTWGKVITEELIVAYGRQARQLCDTIALSFPAVVAGALVLWLVLAYQHFVLARRREPPLSGVHWPTGLTTLLALCALLLVVHRMHAFTEQSDDNSREPISLTLFSGKGPGITPDHNIGYNPAFDRQESAARNSYRIEPGARRKNVILIVADGLRADHMQSYGYRRPTTPYFQRMLSEGMWEQFDNVHSYCAESNCGMVSLLSSRDANRVSTQPFTLAQVLKLHGYAVHMIMGGDQTNYYNIRSLFGKVDSYFDGTMATGYYMADDSFVPVKAQQLPQWNGKPTMLQFHFMSAHIVGKRLDAYNVFQPSQTYAGRVKGGPDERYANFYDNGVLQFDAFARQVLETLRAKHYLDDALVVVTADHGESLGENGRLMHGHGVHQSLLHIPLVISGLAPRPAAASPHVKPVIAQRDIAPTLLHELGMKVPASWTGQPIQRLQASGQNERLSHFAMHEFAGVFDGRQPGRRWKYIVNDYTKEEFVYDLGADPREMRNLLLKAPARLVDEWRRSVAAR